MSANPYQQQAVATASPAQLVLMLYDGAIGAVLRARQAHGEGFAGVPVVNEELQRAQAIVSELLFTLDRDKGGKVAESMASLYDFCLDRLIRANVGKDMTLLDPVVEVLTGLRDAWEMACVNVPATAATG